ncbi:hypothetical protein [Streptomyces hydrogenans]|uniref:hypothetical protein n=1 Tax=Streptomyces hydrogenans TaxID=1873719 RepID=UPI0035DC6D03
MKIESKNASAIASEDTTQDDPRDRLHQLDEDAVVVCRGARIVIALAASDPVDVTESMQFAYDTVIGSLDWGSGFLSHDEYCPCASYWTTEYSGPCRFEGIDGVATAEG